MGGIGPVGLAVFGRHAVVEGELVVDRRAQLARGDLRLLDALRGDVDVQLRRHDASGALVPEGKVIPERSLAVGSPARVVRTLTEEDAAGIERIARHYAEKARRYRSELRVQERSG